MTSRRLRRLRDEDGSNREIERRAIEIERITRWHNQTDDVPRDADSLHRLHRLWECRFAARRREGKRCWLAYSADELSQRHANEKNDEPKNQDNENDQPEVERKNKIPEMEQH